MEFVMDISNNWLTARSFGESQINQFRFGHEQMKRFTVYITVHVIIAQWTKIGI